MIASLCLALCALPAAGDGPAADVLRVYDLNALDPGPADPEQTWGPMLPYVDPRPDKLESDRYDREHDEREEDRDVDAIVSLITALYPEEFQFEGRELSLGEGGRLLVRGPEALHARVRRLLDFLDETLHAEVELAVDVLRTPPGASAFDEVGVLADAARVEALLGAAGQRESYRVRLRADRATTLDRATDRTVVFGYGSEVAEAAAVHEPAMGDVPIGTRLTLRAAPAPGGLHLAVQLLRGDLLEEPRRIDASVFYAVALEQGLREMRAAGVLDALRVLNRSLALDTFLPDGRALVLRTAVDTAAAARELVVLRRVGGALPVVARLELDDAGRELAVADLALVRPPHTAAVGTLVVPEAVARGLETSWNTTVLRGYRALASRVAVPDRDSAHDWLEQALPWLERRSLRGWTLLLPAPPGDGTRLAGTRGSVAETVAALAADARLVDLEVVLRRGEGAPLARARLPLRSGESCALALGVEATELAGWEVEIASRATIASPRLASRLDGLALWLRPTLGAGGAVEVEVRGGGHVRASGPQTVDLGSAITPIVETSVFDHLFVSQRVRLARGAGERRAVLGDAAGGGLRLELVARTVE